MCVKIAFAGEPSWVCIFCILFMRWLWIRSHLRGSLMMSSRKHRILSTIGAVSCVVSMILSVTVLPAIAYANVTKNPLFVAAMAAAAENNRGQNKSGEGGSKKGVQGEAGKGTGKEVKGDKAKGVDKKEGNRAAKGEAVKDNEVVDNKGSKGNGENPNGGGL